MKKLSRGTLAMSLVGLFTVLASGTVLAQEGIQNWDKTHPLEYYQAAPTAPELAQSQEGIQNWDKTHPLEYYLALPAAPELAQSQEGIQNWDKTIPTSPYYSAAVPTQVELSIAQEDSTPCVQC